MIIEGGLRFWNEHIYVVYLGYCFCRDVAFPLCIADIYVVLLFLIGDIDVVNRLYFCWIDVFLVLIAVGFPVCINLRLLLMMFSIAHCGGFHCIYVVNFRYWSWIAVLHCVYFRCKLYVFHLDLLCFWFFTLRTVGFPFPFLSLIMVEFTHFGFWSCLKFVADGFHWELWVRVGFHFLQMDFIEIHVLWSCLSIDSDGSNLTQSVSTLELIWLLVVSIYNCGACSCI